MRAEITLLVLGLVLTVVATFSPVGWGVAAVGIALCVVALLLQDRRLG